MVAEGFTALKFDIDDLEHRAKFDAVNHTINGAELRSMVERVAAVREADRTRHRPVHRPTCPVRRAERLPHRRRNGALQPALAGRAHSGGERRGVEADSHAQRTPICVGENLYLRWGFRELLQQQCADVVMPDVPKCGGLSESRKIAHLAEIYYIPFAPHLVSTPLGTMATCHVCERAQTSSSWSGTPWKSARRGTAMCTRQPAEIDRQGRTHRAA